MGEGWSFEHFVRVALVFALKQQKSILSYQEKQMSKLDDLKASISKLQADVNAFIAANSGGATDADLDALKAQVEAIDAVVNPPAPAA